MTHQDHINKFIEGYKRFSKFNISLYKATKLVSLNEESKHSEIHNNYWVLGMLLQDLKVGEPLKLARVANSKNPSGKDGIFTTSPIISIEDDVVVTQNSQYKLEKLT